jgi:hypothetical protein
MSVAIETEIVEVHYEPDCTQEDVEQVLSSLDRWSGRTARHVTHLRSSERHEYRTTVIVEPNPLAAGTEPIHRQFVRVPTRNVSKSGLGFIAPPRFVPKVLSDSTPLLRSDLMFRVGTELKVKLGPANGKMPVVKGVVIRLRPVYHGFYDVGVQFVTRTE